VLLLLLKQCLDLSLEDKKDIRPILNDSKSADDWLASSGSVGGSSSKTSMESSDDSMDSDDTGTTVSNLAWYGRGKSNKVLKSDSALLEDYFKKRPELMERIQRLRSHKRRRMPDGVLVEDYTFGLALYTSLYKRGSWKVRCIKARLNHRNLLQLSERDREDAELCHS